MTPSLHTIQKKSILLWLSHHILQANVCNSINSNVISSNSYKHHAQMAHGLKVS